ncbi:MAG: type II toxin-antitoxin system VapC family toxin [Euzebya sp.]
MIVIESSALVSFLVGSDPRANRVRQKASTQPLAAPHGVDLEVTSALRGLVLSHKLDAGEAGRALALLASLRLRRYPVTPLLTRIWDLRDNMWPYDAAFVALAEMLDSSLLTVDSKFEGTPGLRCHVECLP